MIHPGKHLSSTTSTPKCMVCTTPTRCGAPALHTKGPRCIGRADGKDDCDCLNACGDDPWIESGRSMPCDHRRETQARIAALTTAAPAAVAGPHVTDAMALAFHSALSDGAVGSDEVEQIKAGLRAALDAAPTTQQAPMESVLIDGIAYPTPAPVAAELLRLHIEAHQAAHSVELGALQAEIAGHEAANLHLSAMVDELRELLQDAKRAMTELHKAAIPDESSEGVPAIIPPDAFRAFVDTHAKLCFCLHQRGHNPVQDVQQPAPQQEAQEPVDSMGMPLSCGKPLCAPGNHHPLCKLAPPPPAPQPSPTPQADSAPAEAVQRIVHLRADRERRVYVAGPMTGLPEYNFPLFNATAARLRSEGWHVENPAEHGHVDGAGWSDYLRWDISRIATCGAIYLLPGWSKSKGATLEVHIAGVLGLQVLLADGAEAPQADSQPAPVVDHKTAEHAMLWRQHCDKLNALVMYCPTCCQGFIAQKEMTRDQIIYECGKTAGRATRTPADNNERAAFEQTLKDWAAKDGDPVDARNLARDTSGAYENDMAEIAWTFWKARADLPAAPQQEAQEPVMIYHGDCTIDCGEHGHHHVELLRMIPAGSKLYTAPQPSPASQGSQ
ncbi:DUF4406 domain-containing protein [Simplicispira sedimenti]|uniref:DUF4406 domain-containing protein n=1 Tax=Simplicispira sedimenti TaxID=2919500 RepID=UPI001FAA51F1|nr:DUF4406 domain-containing protein [Acidovorax sp. W1-6]